MYNRIGGYMESFEVKVEKQLQVIYRKLEQTGLKERIQLAKEELNKDDVAFSLINQYNQLSQNPSRTVCKSHLCSLSNIIK